MAENRAVLIALAETANGLRLGMPGAGNLHLGGLSLAGRGDYVHHFTLSAALAADRAGARFSVRATASEADARQVQALLVGSLDTALYMPEIGDLPEFLPQAVFEGRYGGVGGEGYARLLKKINQRIAALPVQRRAAE